MSFKSLGWCNTYLPLIVPSYRQRVLHFPAAEFFLTIPKDLIDAARVDGCSTFRIYWQIVLPLSIQARPWLFTFMWSWNDFQALIYVVDEAKYALMGLAMFKGRCQPIRRDDGERSVLLTLRSSCCSSSPEDLHPGHQDVRDEERKAVRVNSCPVISRTEAC